MQDSPILSLLFPHSDGGRDGVPLHGPMGGIVAGIRAIINITVDGSGRARGYKQDNQVQRRADRCRVPVLWATRRVSPATARGVPRSVALPLPFSADVAPSRPTIARGGRVTLARGRAPIERGHDGTTLPAFSPGASPGICHQDIGPGVRPMFGHYEDENGHDEPMLRATPCNTAKVVVESGVNKVCLSGRACALNLPDHLPSAPFIRSTVPVVPASSSARLSILPWGTGVSSRSDKVTRNPETPVPPASLM